MTACSNCGTPDKHPFRERCSPCTLSWYTLQLDAALRQKWGQR